MSGYRSFYLMGYSGHAMVVADSIIANNDNILGYFDYAVAVNNPFNLPYVGFENDCDLNFIVGENYLFPSVGNNAVRKKIIMLLENKRLKQSTIVHPSAIVSKYSQIENSTFIAPRAVVNALAFVGKGVILNTGSIIEHGCSIGNYSHIAPGAVLAGDVMIGDSCFIGGNSFIRQGQKIGNNVIVGAGSVVVDNIEDNQVWFGIPAKRYK